MRKLLAVICVISLSVSLGVVGAARVAEPPSEPLTVPVGRQSELWGMSKLVPGQPGGTVTLAISNLPETFNVLIADEAFSLDVADRLMDGLTDVSPATGRTVPGLAKSWEISDDGKEYLFHLRKGLKFSDGEPLTAEDVVFTFRELVFNPDIDANIRDVLKVGGNLPTVEKVGKYAVKFKTPTAFGPFVRQIGIGIYPKHVFEGVSPQEFNSAWSSETAGKTPEKIVGAGPFRLKEFAAGNKVVLERNPYYYKLDPAGTQLPYLQRLIFLEVAGRDVSLLKFTSGETDIIDARARDLPFLIQHADEKGCKVIVNQGPSGAPASTDFLTFNWDAPREDLADFFANVRFRRAISYAIDRREVINAVFKGLARTTGSPVATFSDYHCPEAVRAFPLEHDPRRARELLQDLDLKDLDDDGIRELPGGGDLSFRVLTDKGSTVRVEMGEAIASDLKEVGVDMSLTPLDFDTMIEKLFSSNYQGVITSLVRDPLEPNSLTPIYRSSGNLHLWHLSGRNHPTTTEMKMDRLLKEGVGHVGLESRKPYYDRFQLLVAERVPVIYIAGPVYTYAHVRSLENTNTFGPLASFLGHCQYVWKSDR